MKRSLKSLLALMLAYFMLISGTCDGVFSVAVLAAEREDVFAYADSETHDAADNDAAAPEDACVGQILPGNTIAEETEETSLYKTGDALTTLLKVELREDVSLKTSYEPGGIVLLELDLASAEALSESAPVRKLLNMVFLLGIKDHASDLHFEPFEHP